MAIDASAQKPKRFNLRFWRRGNNPSPTGQKAESPALPLHRPTSVLRGFGSGQMRSLLSVLLPGTRYDYETEAGDLSLNSIVAACLRFYVTNWPQARPRLARQVDGAETLIADHPIVRLLAQPDPTMPSNTFWEQVLIDFWIHGNAYLYKRRSAGGVGEPVALQWLPADMVDVVPDASDPGGRVYPYRVWGRLVATISSADIIHLRQGRDPDNHLRGRSYLISTLREIAADNSHSTVAGALSRNNGIGGWMIGPKGESAPDAPYAGPDESEADTIRRRFVEQTTGDQAGGAVVLTSDFHAERMSFSPEELALDDARATPEERVCAIFSLPPIAVGMGAGLRRGTMANYKEARQQAWEDGILPLMDYVAAACSHSLVPDFPAQVEQDDVLAYDTSRVRALRDDESAKVRDAALAYRSGMWDREMAKIHSGKRPEPLDKGAYALASMPGESDPNKTGDPGGLPKNTPQPKNSGGDPIKAQSMKRALAIKNEGSLLAEAKRQRQVLLGAQQDAADAVLEILAAAKAGLESELAALEEELAALVEQGHTLSEGQIAQLDRYQSLVRQAQAAFNNAAQPAAEVTTQAQAQAAMLGGASAQALTQAQIGTQIRWNALPEAALRALAGTMGDGSSVADHFQKLGPDAVETLRKALAQGIAAGKGPRTIGKALEGALGTSFVRAQTIARTETIRAFREGARRTYQANADVVAGYVRLSAADARTCAACWALHGTTHQVSEIMPSHPNCRCVMVPLVEGGQVIPDRDELFGALPENSQRQVLGAQGFELFAGGVPLASFAVVEESKFGPTARVATLAELGAGNQ